MNLIFSIFVVFLLNFLLACSLKQDSPVPGSPQVPVTPNTPEVSVGQTLSNRQSEKAQIQEDQALNEMIKQLLIPAYRDLSQKIQALSEDIHTSFSSTENINLQPLFESHSDKLYFAHIKEPAWSTLRTLYDRSQLAFLEDPALLEPEEEPYNFKSPEGPFLEKNKALYKKLREANPYHEQGIRAREIGLSAVEVADTEFAKGQKPMAERSYQAGQAMTGIVSGHLLEGLAQNIYEFCVGKRLLDGKKIEFIGPISMPALICPEKNKKEGY